MSNKRKRYDFIMKTITYVASSVAIIILFMIVFFVVRNGTNLLSFDLLTSDYHSHVYNGGIDPVTDFSQTSKPDHLTDEDYYSQKWGIALSDGEGKQGEERVIVSFVAEDSPLNHMVNRNDSNDEDFQIKEGYIIQMIKFEGRQSALEIYGAQYMINSLEEVDTFRELVFAEVGGGIRGSLLTTLYTIGLTLIVALPVGIFTAIYFNEFANKNKFTQFMRTLIDTLTGVPSIIFGLMGLAVFVPLTVRYTPATSGNILSGSLTLAVILLPVIIKSTEESLKVVPDDFRQASLALGANHTQTTFKVVLPSALPGILTATLLSIGRIIGESAALIFAVGTAIKDDISIFGKSTTLSVHIWSLLTDEPANIPLATTIALIILMVVLGLNLLVKLLSIKFMKKFS